MELFIFISNLYSLGSFCNVSLSLWMFFIIISRVTGSKFCTTKGGEIERYFIDMNSVWEVLKSKFRLMLYTFALSMKNSRLLCLCEESLLWTILDTITTGFRSNISLSSCYKLISTFEVHSKIESLWIPRPWGCDNKGRILTWLNPQAFKGIITEDSGLIVISWHYKNLDSGASSILKLLLNSSSMLLLIKKELL